MHVCVCVCLLVRTSGLATADVTGMVRECVDDPVQLMLVAVLDKTVLCRHQQLDEYITIYPILTALINTVNHVGK